MSHDNVVLTTEAEYAELVNSIKGSNITEDGFILKKGRIELDGTEIEGSFGINAKMNQKGDFSVSVRGPLGIELVRLLAVGNSIAAIDRFNKTVYIGQKDEIMNRYGMPDDFMKIVLGDVPDIALKRLGTVSYGIMTLLSEEGDFMREISVCINERKICSEEITRTDYPGRQILLQFNDFRMTGDRKYASSIEMEEKSGMFHVKLFIDELEIGFNSDIEFNMPSYTRKNL